MRSLFFLSALIISAVVAVPNYGPPPAAKCSCRAPFVNGKQYNLEHKTSGLLLSFCTGCLVKSDASVVAKELAISNAPYNVWTIALSGNTASLQMNHQYLQGAGPFTLKAGTCQDNGEYILTVNNDKSSGKWTVQTHPDKECSFSLKDEQGRYLCAANKSNFAYANPAVKDIKADVAATEFTDNCLFFAYRLN